MRELVRKLWFELPEDPRGFFSIWGWWERRRILFNLIVLPAGFVALVLLLTVSANAHGLPPGEDMVEPFAVLGAPIILNVLYTAGAFFESFVWALNRRRTDRTGPFLFALGTWTILLMMAFVVVAPFVFAHPMPPTLGAESSNQL